MPAGRQPVETVARRREEHPRRRVRRPSRSATLARQQPLAAPRVAPWAALRSTRSTEPPLHATCTPTTWPCVVEKPAVPATTMVAASRPGRPPRPSRSHSPSSTGCRCGLRSRCVPPVKSREVDVGSSDQREHDLEPVQHVGRRERCWSPSHDFAERLQARDSSFVGPGPESAAGAGPRRAGRSVPRRPPRGPAGTGRPRQVPRRPPVRARHEPMTTQVRAGVAAARVLAQQR